ncbi:hypothetical protein ACFSKU_00310 [Pontibacter silvestris]|uniref:DUF3450 domain-containing protein n=1 Tax=Pontibacter silvestris TaxID=2305183 RepID=A0ABW4WSA7_9BACT|nr:hypothetical protein [Pontibacter silvestris]MCC9138194.1 hypothetical protein [Pontibacter silvestris]
MKKMKGWMLLLSFMAVVFGANAQTQSQVEQDLANLRTWMREKSNIADNKVREEWPNVKREYKELTSSLDRNASKLSDKSKEEYKELKSKYNEWEEENEAETVDLDGHKLERWEKDMTGTTQISRIKSANLRDAYMSLMEYTREYRRNWTALDWKYAEFVYGELNSRKSQVMDNLTNGDKIKIAALQVEFEALRKTHSK